MSDRTQAQISTIERRVVRIPTADLVDGWRQVIEVELDWVCPTCGGRRGEIGPAIAMDGRYRMHVDGWKNPCGHLDKYADVEVEALSTAGARLTADLRREARS